MAMVPVISEEKVRKSEDPGWGEIRCQTVLLSYMIGLFYIYSP